MKKLAVITLLGATLLTTAKPSTADFKVTEAPELCRNAHALLVASTSDRHTYIWREIARAATSDRDKWEVVDDYEPGVVRRVSFRQYDVSSQSGKVAYVVHCGHGGTCNALAQAFFKAHSNWYSPTVYCGAIPDGLNNPSKPDLADL